MTRKTTNKIDPSRLPPPTLPPQKSPIQVPTSTLPQHQTPHLTNSTYHTNLLLPLFPLPSTPACHHLTSPSHIPSLSHPYPHSTHLSPCLSSNTPDGVPASKLHSGSGKKKKREKGMAVVGMVEVLGTCAWWVIHRGRGWEKGRWRDGEWGMGDGGWGPGR